MWMSFSIRTKDSIDFGLIPFALVLEPIQYIRINPK